MLGDARDHPRLAGAASGALSGTGAFATNETSGETQALIEAGSNVTSTGVELIALVRGGGARTDLAAFDGERIARAIAASPIPVWTGIGHETDRSVADEVAHTSFKTPTACADAIVDLVRANVEHAERTWARISTLGVARIDEHDERLRAAARMVVAMPLPDVVEDHAQEEELRARDLVHHLREQWMRLRELAGS